MQAIKIHAGKLYQNTGSGWTPISVEKNPTQYSHYERDLTDGGKHFNNVQVFDRYFGWRMPDDRYLGIHRQLSRNERLISPTCYCFDGSLPNMNKLTQKHLLQTYFTGQKELPSEVIEYDEPVDGGVIHRKFDNTVQTAGFHDLYFHLLRTPMNHTNETDTGKRITLVIQIPWAYVPDGMYFTYFPIYRTSDFGATGKELDFHYAITHTDVHVTKATHEVISGKITYTGKDDRCIIKDSKGNALYGEDANPKLMKLYKKDAGGKKFTQIIFDFPADWGSNRDSMGAIAFDAYIHEDVAPYYRVPLHPYLVDYSKFPPASKNTPVNLSYFNQFPVFMKQGDILDIWSWKEESDTNSHIVMKKIMCIGPVYTKAGVLNTGNGQQPWLSQTPGLQLSSAELNSLLSRNDSSEGIYTWVTTE